MSKKCELTGKNPLKGHNVSHANNKTKRRFLPNLKKVKFTSELLKRSLKLTVSNAGVRSVDKKGSFDQYLKTVNCEVGVVSINSVTETQVWSNHKLVEKGCISSCGLFRRRIRSPSEARN